MTRLGDARRWLFAFGVLALSSAGGPAAARPPQGTNLLFTFVTNQAGFDTNLTVANTTQDAAGATPIDGTCTFYFYGANAPAPTATPVSAGTVFTTLASVVAPNFLGYAIAQCSIPLLHGWAYVGDLGLRNLAASYPALVIPPGKRKKLEQLDE